MKELSKSSLSKFSLNLHEGQAVVRNQNRINGLIGVRNSAIPDTYHNLLARANFSGSPFNETIVWSTDVFESEPQRLSELSEEGFRRYKGILDDALAAYADAFKDADNTVRELIHAAVTYSDLSSVFCGDGRVVITEWGMHPKDKSDMMGMPMSVDSPLEAKAKTEQEDIAGSGPDDGNVPVQDKPDEEENNVVVDHDDNNRDMSRSGTDASPSGQSRSGKPDAGAGGADNAGQGDADNGTSGNHTDGTGSHSGGGDGNGGENSGKKKSRLWPWLAALIALAFLLLLIFSRDCSNAKPPIPVTPPMDSSQVELSPDSLRYIVNNRILLFVTNDNVTMKDFAKDFRKKYPDGKKYVLSNPDTVVNRITLTLPKEEREQMAERLPAEFEEYGLIVIPETMYEGSYTATDPDFDDYGKSWYFEECSVYDAWNVTMGSEDIIVAVIDDGFDLNHPELKGKAVKPYNTVTHSGNVAASPNGHGTHVAATAVGKADNGAGTSGIAPKCKLMPIQVGDSQGNVTTSAVLDGVIYALSNGADVVNMSLGMSFGPFVQFAPLFVQKNFRSNMFLDEESVWNHLFDVARQRNVTFVIAGGNENCLIGMDPMQRSPNTIKVSAVQQDEKKAAFSNYGDMSTVSAPGVRIYNAIPGNNYTYMDGTSMAAPIVSGGCALLKSRDPYLSTAEISRILAQTGIPSPSDVGPIVNFALALDADVSVVDECDDVNKRYNELLAELDKLRKEHPGCIQDPDTMAIPKNLTLDQLFGKWRSTTSLTNKQDEEVVLYFTFNGTSSGLLEIVEPDGEVYSAGLQVSISDDKLFVDQVQSATSSSSRSAYNPYSFVLKPDRNRKAEGTAKNKVEFANMFKFNLIKI